MILTEHARSSRNSIMGGGSNIEGEFLSWQLHFRSARKTNKKTVLDHSCNKHRSVYSKGKECPGSEKTALNKQREELVSQNKTVI